MTVDRVRHRDRRQATPSTRRARSRSTRPATRRPRTSTGRTSSRAALSIKMRGGSLGHHQVVREGRALQPAGRASDVRRPRSTRSGRWRRSSSSTARTRSVSAATSSRRRRRAATMVGAAGMAPHADRRCNGNTFADETEEETREQRSRSASRTIGLRLLNRTRGTADFGADPVASVLRTATSARSRRSSSARRSSPPYNFIAREQGQRSSGSRTRSIEKKEIYGDDLVRLLDARTSRSPRSTGRRKRHGRRCDERHGDPRPCAGRSAARGARARRRTGSASSSSTACSAACSRSRSWARRLRGPVDQPGAERGRRGSRAAAASARRSRSPTTSASRTASPNGEPARRRDREGAVRIPEQRGAHVPIHYFAIHGVEGRRDQIIPVSSSDSVMYSLCGLGTSCAIASGKPSARARHARAPRDPRARALHVQVRQRDQDRRRVHARRRTARQCRSSSCRSPISTAELKTPLAQTLGSKTPLPAAIPAREVQLDRRDDGLARLHVRTVADAAGRPRARPEAVAGVVGAASAGEPRRPSRRASLR